MINYAVIDSYYNIISGSPDVYQYIGTTNFMPLLKLIHEEDLPRYKNTLLRIAKNESTFERNVIRVKNNVGEYHWLSFETRKNAQDIDGKIAWYIEINDVYNAIKRYNDIHIENTVLKKTAALLNTIMFTYTPDTQQLRIFSTEKNREKIHYKGKIDSFVELLHSKSCIAEESKIAFEMLIDSVKNFSGAFSYDIHNYIFSDDHSVTVTTVKGDAIYRNGESSGIVGIITNKSEALGQSSYGSSFKDFEIDSMTGLYSKTGIIDYTKELIAHRKTENIVFAIIDLDNFKLVNDNLGHSYGDDVIIRTAKILSSYIGDKGAVGHFGGDEFVIVLNDVKLMDEFRMYFRAIRSTIETEFSNISTNFKITCSIGVSECPVDADNYDDLFEIADKCLYTAKEYGKNRYVIYDERSKKIINSLDNNVGERKSKHMVQQNAFIASIFKTLFKSGADGIDEVLQQIGGEFAFANIKIYSGEDMHLSHCCGSVPSKEETCKCLLTSDYLSSFNRNNLFILTNVNKFAEKNPDVYHYLSKHKVYSAMQYLIKDNDEIKGLISYEYENKSIIYLTETQLNNLALISQILSDFIK